MSDLAVQQISTILAEHAESLCRELLPAGRREGREWRCGSVQGEPGQSMAVHLAGSRAGVWSDFATGEAGDALDLVGAVLQLKKRDAIKWATRWLGIGDATDIEVSKLDQPPSGAATRMARPRRERITLAGSGARAKLRPAQTWSVTYKDARSRSTCHRLSASIPV